MPQLFLLPEPPVIPSVMLTHNNILSNVMHLFHIFPVDETCRAVSYPPLCHVYERTNIYILLYLGVSIYYAENMATIAQNIQEIKPHILTTVPRLLEKVYDKILAKGRKLKPIPRWLFFQAVALGDQFEYLKNWCHEKEIPFGENETIIKLPEIIARFKREVKKYNKNFGDTEKN